MPRGRPRKDTVYNPTPEAPLPEQRYQGYEPQPRADEPVSVLPAAPRAAQMDAPVSRDDLPSGYDDAAEARRHAEEIRRKRTRPFGSLGQKLALPERPYYKRHWFNDTPGRIDQAKGSGWAHVKEGDDPIKRVVGSGRDGGALHAYAMEIPREIFEEEETARNAMAQAKVDEIRNNPFRAAPGTAKRSDAGKFYSPDESGPLTVKGPGA